MLLATDEKQQFEHAVFYSKNQEKHFSVCCSTFFFSLLLFFALGLPEKNLVLSLFFLFVLIWPASIAFSFSCISCQPVFRVSSFHQLLMFQQALTLKHSCGVVRTGCQGGHNQGEYYLPLHGPEVSHSPVAIRKAIKKGDKSLLIAVSAQAYWSSDGTRIKLSFRNSCFRSTMLHHM